ncbi:MAG: NAD(P)-dependent oxidoreductase [Cyanobacteria bacterium SBLK]|nr:NAD(P)-dependent oxidoreductase [Cyanobacteria bacterium SBLK]
MKIGFIGLGIMGSRMAANLQQQGHPLVIFNRSPEKAIPLVKKGATQVNTPAEVAKHADILFTMLAHPEAVTETALGKDGFLVHFTPNSLWVDCSTVHPSFSREMAREAHEKKIRFLDAPVAGSKNQAQQAQLVFLVGGEEADFQECQPLLETMGKKVIRMGENGMGSAFKLVLNHLLATSMAAFSEGLILGEALGISLETLLNILVGGPVAAPYLALKRSKLENDDYEAEFPLQWMQKDLQMVSLAAYESNVAMPLGNTAKEMYRLCLQRGLGEQDFSAIYAFLKEGSGGDRVAS